MKKLILKILLESRLDHGRIIKFYGISRDIDKGLYYLVLEHANQGNLREFLIKKRNCSFEWEERVRLAVQITEGLQYLHKLHIAHRDLHTKNILMNNGNIKISDFGLSKNLNSIMSSNNKFFGMIPFIDPQKINNGKKFILDKRSDIYSLGMVLWEISSCRTPFCEEDLACLSLKICQGLKEKSVKGTPMDYIQIYTNCWQFEPDSRPLINQVLSLLQFMSLKPVFEGDDEFISSRSPDSSHDTSRNSTSGYSNNVSSLTIPDNLAFSRNILNSTNSFNEHQFEVTLPTLPPITSLGTFSLFQPSIPDNSMVKSQMYPSPNLVFGSPWSTSHLEDPYVDSRHHSPDHLEAGLTQTIVPSSTAYDNTITTAANLFDF